MFFCNYEVDNVEIKVQLIKVIAENPMKYPPDRTTVKILACVFREDIFIFNIQISKASFLFLIKKIMDVEEAYSVP